MACVVWWTGNHGDHVHHCAYEMSPYPHLHVCDCGASMAYTNLVV